MKKQVLLYSGGLDSFITAHMFPNAKLLYINSKARYAHKEIRNVDIAPRPVILLNNVLNLSAWEREDAIVPARNLFLVALASLYGDEILLASTAGDNSTDKDTVFTEKSGELLTHIYDCSHFSRGSIKVLAPTKKLTKKDLIQWYLSQYNDPDKLLKTISCYDEGEGHCGQCKACIRRWTAFEACGVETNNYSVHPKYFDWFPILQKMNTRGGWRCPEEDLYTLNALKKYGIV